MSRAAARAARRLRRGPYLEDATLRVTAPGSRNEFGEHVPGAATETVVRVATAPLSGEEREALPDGLRSRNVRRFWIAQAVEGVVEGNDGADAPVLAYAGRTFQVIELERWGGEFSELMAVEQRAAS